jgi:serine/threonine-protein kinase
MIRFQMLGTLDLRDSQDREVHSVLRRPKLLAVVGYLAIARPAGFHRRDSLVALLWPELDHAHARNALRQAVHAVRQALGHDLLRARGEEELAVDGSRMRCDVRDFEAAFEAGELENAVELYRGALFSSSAGWTRSGSTCDGERVRPPSSSSTARTQPGMP